MDDANRIEEAHGGLRVEVRGPAADRTAAAVAALSADGVPAALAGKDAALWGPGAAELAAVRLGWLDLPRSSRQLLPRLEALRAELRAQGLDRVVLAEGATLGPNSVILPSATIGRHSTVGPASLVMRGESVPSRTRWIGNPIGPWEEES